MLVLLPALMLVQTEPTVPPESLDVIVLRHRGLPADMTARYAVSYSEGTYEIELLQDRGWFNSHMKLVSFSFNGEDLIDTPEERALAEMVTYFRRGFITDFGCLPDGETDCHMYLWMEGFTSDLGPSDDDVRCRFVMDWHGEPRFGCG